MPPIRPEWSAPREQVVDAASHADRDAAHAARESAGVACFDDQMDMVVLEREMNEPEALRIAACCAGERETNRRENVLTSEGGEAGAQCDVDGLGCAVVWSRAMGDVAAGCPLASRTPSSAAPTCGEVQLEL